MTYSLTYPIARCALVALNQSSVVAKSQVSAFQNSILVKLLNKIIKIYCLQCKIISLN